MTLRTRSHWICLAVSAAGLLLFAQPVASQTVTGTLFGRVLDAGDLPLPGASVSVSSPQLIGGAQTRVTDGNGEYRFPALPPGDYSMNAEMSGFATVAGAGILLGAGAYI